MNIPYVQAFYADDSGNSIGFALAEGQSVPQEWIDRAKTLGDNGNDIELFATYKCCVDLDTLDQDCISEGTLGVLGPCSDMVYFRTKHGKKAGILIEIVLLHPDEFVGLDCGDCQDCGDGRCQES